MQPKKNKEIPTFVLAGKRLQYDNECPDAYKNITNACWTHQAEQRPSANEAAKQLKELFQRLEKGESDASDEEPKAEDDD